VIWIGVACSFYKPVDRSRKIERRKWSSEPKGGRPLILDIRSQKIALGPNGKILT